MEFFKLLLCKEKSPLLQIREIGGARKYSLKE